MPHISKEWEVPAGLTASQNSSIINCKTIYHCNLQVTGMKNQKIHVVATIRHQCQLRQTQAERQH